MERLYLKRRTGSVDDLFDIVSNYLISQGFRRGVTCRYKSEEVGIIHEGIFRKNDTRAVVELECWERQISIQNSTPDGPLTFPGKYNGTISFENVNENEIKRVKGLLGKIAYEPPQLKK